MELKESFEKLRKPIEIMHYILNAFWLTGVFYLLMSLEIITADSGPLAYLVAVFITLAIGDRLVHGVLEYD